MYIVCGRSPEDTTAPPTHKCAVDTRTKLQALSTAGPIRGLRLALGVFPCTKKYRSDMPGAAGGSNVRPSPPAPPHCAAAHDSPSRARPTRGLRRLLRGISWVSRGPVTIQGAAPVNILKNSNPPTRPFSTRTFSGSSQKSTGQVQKKPLLLH